MRAAISYIKSRFSSSRLLIGAEIGVEKGDHAAQILTELRIKLLYLVDIWKSFSQNGFMMFGGGIAERNYQYVTKRFSSHSEVQIWRKESEAAANAIQDKSLDFVYIDACHQYEDVLNDIRVWLPKVKSGGILCGHDYNARWWPGVVQAVDEFGKESGFEIYYERNPGTNNSDWWAVIESDSN